MSGRGALVAACVAIAAALVATPGGAFSVDPMHTFAPAFRHGDSGTGVHELITRAAVKRAYPSAPANLVTNLQFATASTDFMHHFDGKLSGTVKDGKLSGTWNEWPRGTDYDRGGFIFERTSTGISGRWNYDAGGGLPVLQQGARQCRGEDSNL